MCRKKKDLFFLFLLTQTIFVTVGVVIVNVVNVNATMNDLELTASALIVDAVETMKGNAEVCVSLFIQLL